MGEINDFGMSIAQGHYDAQEPPEAEVDTSCENCAEDTGDDSGMCDDCNAVAPAGQAALDMRAFLAGQGEKPWAKQATASDIIDVFENFLVGLAQEAKAQNDAEKKLYERDHKRHCEAAALRRELEALLPRDEAHREVWQRIALLHHLAR